MSHSINEEGPRSSKNQYFNTTISKLGLLNLLTNTREELVPEGNIPLLKEQIEEKK